MNPSTGDLLMQHYCFQITDTTFEVLVILELAKIHSRSCEDCRELSSFMQVLREGSHSCWCCVQHTGQCLSVSESRFQELSLGLAQLSALLRCWISCNCIGASAGQGKGFWAWGSPTRLLEAINIVQRARAISVAVRSAPPCAVCC